MLKSLLIRNFQSHKKSILKFDPGVNVILGKSDSGKTAILRSLKLGMFNKPGGDSYCSDWGGETKVRVKTETDTITRIKEKSNNIYNLNEQEFKAFGQSVPEEIEKSLSVSEINLQAQFDSPFLLTNTPGDVAKHFNKLVHLNKIDSSQAFVKSAIGKINKQLGIEESNINKYTLELEKYVGLKKMEIDVEVLDEMETESLNVSNCIQKIKSLEKQIINTEFEIKEISKILVFEPAINELLDLYADTAILSTEFDTISSLNANIVTKEKSIEKDRFLLKFKSPIDVLLKLYEGIGLLSKQIKEIEKSSGDINEIEGDIKLLKFQLITFEKEFKKEMPEICPLCGTKIENHE